MPLEIPRYDLELCHGEGPRCYARMDENPSGDYAEVSDVAYSLNVLNDLIVRGEYYAARDYLEQMRAALAEAGSPPARN